MNDFNGVRTLKNDRATMESDNNMGIDNYKRIFGLADCSAASRSGVSVLTLETGAESAGKRKKTVGPGICRKAAVALVILVAVLALMLTACGSANEKVKNAMTKESYYFDTICRISIYNMKNMSDEHAEKAIDGAFRLCADYEKLLSKTKAGSDIYRVNHAAGKPVRCDPRTISVIKKGIYYGKISGGDFDITIGKAEDLYNFHSENPKVPTKKQLAEAAKYVNYKQIKINGDNVRMTTKKGEIDLGGIAKGYIGDRVGEYLQKQGVTSAIVSLGGNIITVGDKGGHPFRIGIEKPFSEQSEIVGFTEVKDKTVVTSGIYERYFKKNGKLYHHILIPKTGEPANTDIQGVTITAESGRSADCDALATICQIKGKKKALAFMEKQKGCSALIIDDSGKISKTASMDFTAS